MDSGTIASTEAAHARPGSNHGTELGAMDMRALRLLAWKQQPELVTVPDPDPGPGEVRVRIGGAGACHSDLHLMHDFDEGLLPWGPPFTLGHENAGWVDALGPGVSGVEVGEPVAVHGPWGCGSCPRCAQGLENYCARQATLPVAGGGLGADGGMAQYMIVPSTRHLVPIGDLSPVDAAPLTDAALTPYHAVKRSLPLLVPGATAVVIGVGGLGHMAVQILRALGPARIVAVDRRPEALDLARDVGADATVVMSEDASETIRAETAGLGADVVLDFVGVDETLRLGAATARSLGHLTIVGIGGGTLPVGFFTVPYELSVATTYWGSRPELIEVIALAQAGLVTPHVEQFSLEDAPHAYELMRDGKLQGRAVVVPE
jgi:propanol-preferring alcohol dehydrogenase